MLDQQASRDENSSQAKRLVLGYVEFAAEDVDSGWVPPGWATCNVVEVDLERVSKFLVDILTERNTKYWNQS